MAQPVPGRQQQYGKPALLASCAKSASLCLYALLCTLN